ncbi:MAG: hypothetical protein KDA24_01525 [Deltaproteobacteria bacterium]|nr:hypothetical protein [Deltaproteobacteria bacterium]
MKPLPLLIVAVTVVLLVASSCKAPVYEEFVHWPLRGQHLTHEDATCTGCHGSSVENTISTTCGGCHEDERLSLEHYPGQDCIDCHNEMGWDVGAIVDHDFFPLELGHDNVPCLDCHLNENDFGDISTTCESCHARPEEHFAGACEDCHNTSDWFDAEFDHREFFPTPHEGVSACGDCHPQASTGNYTAFTCTDCHAHRQADMADEHLGEVAGYVYESGACLSCHPNGEED